jgi:hypothetical protein
MKKLLYVMVFVMLLMFGFGCTKETKVVSTPAVEQETDNKTLEVRSQILVPWDEKRKNFWVSVYFARMSFDPNLRQRFLPHNLYGVCVCIIDEFEKLYELEEFEAKVQNNSTGKVNPEVQGLIWNISYGCSQIWLQKQMQELMDQQTQIPVDPI